MKIIVVNTYSSIKLFPKKYQKTQVFADYRKDIVIPMSRLYLSVIRTINDSIQ